MTAGSGGWSVNQTGGGGETNSIYSISFTSSFSTTPTVTGSPFPFVFSGDGTTYAATLTVANITTSNVVVSMRESSSNNTWRTSFCFMAVN
jgi:hypothetical protein